MTSRTTAVSDQTVTSRHQTVVPWYREPWPWLLMAGPFAVVIAGIVTAIIAWRTNDALVADDYYKQGLAINRILAREDEAVRLGLVASVAFSNDRSKVRVVLRGDTIGKGLAVAAKPRGYSGADSLTLRLVHPTRDGHDQEINLLRVAEGVFEGKLKTQVGTRWQLLLQDSTDRWRLSGWWTVTEDNVALGAGLN